MKSVKGIFLVSVLLIGILAVALAVTSSNVQAAACPSPITTDITLSADCTGNTAITADNVTLDCAGFEFIGSNQVVGINLTGRTGVTVQNCTASGFGTGFSLGGAGTGNTLTNNTATNNKLGFSLGIGTSGNTLTNNTAIDNNVGGAPIGFRISNSTGNRLTNNTASGSGFAGFFVSGDGTGNIFELNTARDNGTRGWRMDNARGNMFDRNIAKDNNNEGFALFFTSTGNVLTGNQSLRNFIGIGLSNASTGNTVENNTLSNNTGSACRDGTGAAGPVLNTWTNNAAIANGAPDFPVDLCTLEVDIDIKPGSDPNCFNSNDHGVIPVAILGSATFDASDVNPLTVELDGQDVRVKGKSGNAGSLQDVNNDGFVDLVVQIIDDAAYVPGNTIGTITGQLNDGTLFIGTDSICITQ